MPADRSRASTHDGAEYGVANVFVSTTSAIPNIPSGGIAFAPNVTPGTFNDPPPPMDDALPCDSLLFPPQKGDCPSTRKSGHGRKKPENYIPRPPNAFILFRSSFIKSQHVSTGVETNHSTLSKIIGLTWQNLPNEERQIWHRKAKIAEEQHRIKFPQYAFKPLHTKTKGSGGKRKVREVGPKDQKRCAKIAELLVQGKKGGELDAAIKEFDKHHIPEIVTRFEAPITIHSFQRSCSAPIPESSPGPSRKPRSASFQPSGRSTPAIACPTPSPLSLPAQTQDLGQAYYTMPSFDPYSFTTKDEPSFDFDTFSFNPILQPSFHCEPMTQNINPLDNAFIQPSPQTTLLPQLSIDVSFIDVKTWSRCNSPMSPSTNSMPTTPSYIGSPTPQEPYGTYTLEPTPDYSLDKSFNPLTQYPTFSDPSTSYNGANHHYVDPNCGYSSQLEQQKSQAVQAELDYSAFMASIPSYPLV